MYTLAEAAKLKQTTLERGVYETFVQESKFLDLVPFKPIAGSAYGYNEELTLPGVEYRAVNSAYSESTGTVNPKEEKIVIGGGEADVDTFLVKTQGGLNDLRAGAERAKVKSIAYQFQNTFINGDTAVDANAFDGLKKRLVGGQVMDPAGTGIAINTDDATRNAFIDFLDQLLALVPGIDERNGLLIMNAFITGQFLSAMRRLKLTVAEDVENGKLVRRFRGIQVVDPGQTAAGAMILPQTEPDGAGAPVLNTSSVYAVKLGRDVSDRGVTGLENGGVQVEDLGKLQSKPAYRTRIEFFHGLALFGGQAAARGRRIRNA